MNGPQDMGGFVRFGPINPEKDEPVFHTEWERRAFALNLVMGMTGTWNIDQMRHGRERLDPFTYWSSSYYEYRHYGLELQMAEDGLATPEEIKSGRMKVTPLPVKRVAKAAMIPGILKSGGPATRPSNLPQGFQIGDKVRARNITPEGHTRLVRYARGHVGEIALVHGTHVFPDSSAHGKGDDPQWLYAVRFTAKELWGHDSNDAVNIDLWEFILNPLEQDPVFAEPWEAQAFALAVKLHEKGVFTWSEWAETLGATIKAHPRAPYYECWLAALENLVEAKGVMTNPERLSRIDAWDEAACSTPHGRPIELSRSERAPEKH